MILQAAAMSAMISACSPAVAVKDLAALAHNESGGDTLAIHDNTTRTTHRPQDPETAAALAEKLLSAGHSIDLGLMQINSKNLRLLGLSIESAFDGCSSVRAASDLLSRVSAYNTGTATRGFRNGYVARFIAARSNDPPMAAQSEPPPPAESPFAAPAKTGPEMVFTITRR